MQLYFSPMSCSLATRIALYECGGEHTFLEVDARTKLLPDGSDYRAIHPLGLVPMIRADDGTMLSENAAILQFVARRHPHAQLAPADDSGSARLQQWLCFIGTELHKAVFMPLLDKESPEGAKQYALGKAQSRLDLVASHLEPREFLLDAFSVADAYLTAVLGWAAVTPIELERWPTLLAYLQRMRARPSVRRATAEEFALYTRAH
jgi:glutathione S-transferase